MIDTIEIPKSWEIVKLSKVAHKITDGSHNPPQGKSFGIPMISAKDVHNNSISFDSPRYISDDDFETENKRTQIKPGDILLTIVATIGRTAVVPMNTKPFTLQRSVAVIKPDINAAYLCYYFQSPFFQRQLTKHAKGTAQKGVYLKTLNELKVVLPPPNEHLPIVSKIEELFSEVDKGIEEIETAQQQLKVYRQAVLKWAFQGKLTEEWRKQQNSLTDAEDILKQIQTLKGKKYKSLTPLNEEELAELFELPKGWKWVKNQDYLFEVKDGTHDTPTYIANGIPFITQKNIREDGLELTNVQFISEEDHKKFYQRSNVAKGDVLISMIGHNRGMTALVDTDEVFSIKNVGLFKFIPSLQSNMFSFYYYQSQVGRNIVLKKSKGGAQPFIGLTELRNWAVVVCSLEEQQQIVQEIESRLSVCDKIEETITNSLKQAEALRQSILKKAFEGKLI